MKKNLFKILLFTVLIPALYTACSRPEEQISADSLEISIREILELPVYEQIYRDIVYLGEKQKVLFFTASDKEVLFSIDIRIQAGIKNAALVGIKEIKDNGEGDKSAVVYLPPSEVLLADADEQTIEQFFIKERGDEISRLEYYDEINRKKQELINTAIKSGLLDTADSNARILITGFLKLAGFDSVEFTGTGNDDAGSSQDE